MEAVEFLEQEDVDAFLPPYRPEHVVLDPDNVMSLGQVAMDASYITEFKAQQETAMENAKQVIGEVDAEYGEKFGRSYGGVISAEMMEGAEIAVVAAGTTCTTARELVKRLRDEQNLPVGLVKIRAVRPFPTEALREALASVKLVGVLDRNISVGGSGILYPEVTAAFSGTKGPHIVDYILGLGGREITEQDLEAIIMELYEERDLATIENTVRMPQLRKA